MLKPLCTYIQECYTKEMDPKPKKVKMGRIGYCICFGYAIIVLKYLKIFNKLNCIIVDNGTMMQIEYLLQRIWNSPTNMLYYK